MPGQGKYTQYEPDKTRNMGLGTSSVTLLDDMFKSNAEVYTPASLFPRANEHLLARKGGIRIRQKGDINQFPDGVDMSYKDAPDFQKSADIVKTGDQGWPSSVYTPNIKSPGEVLGRVNIDPSKITAMGDDALKQFRITEKMGNNGLLNPNAVSVNLGNSVGITDGKIGEGTILIPGLAPGAAKQA